MGRRHWRCVVEGCIGSKRNKNQNEVPEDVSFYRIPCVVKNQGEKTEELSAYRRTQWIVKLRLSNVTEYTRVCSRHFYSGAPSKLFDKTNPDWLPNNLKSIADTPAVVKRYDGRIKRSRQDSLSLKPTKHQRKRIGIPIASSTPIALSTPHSKKSNLGPQYGNSTVCFEKSFDGTSVPTLEYSDTSFTMSSVENINTALQLSHLQDSVNTEIELPVRKRSIVTETVPIITYLTQETQTELNATYIARETQTLHSSSSQETQTELNATHITRETQTLHSSSSQESQTEHLNIRHSIIQTSFRVCYQFELESVEIKLNECKEVIKNLNFEIVQASETIKHQLEQIDKLNLHIKNMEENLDSLKFTPSCFRGDPGKILFFTGLTSYEYLIDIVEEIEPYLFKNSKLSPFQQFILTVMKLRLSPSNKDIAYRFCISEAVVGRIFYNCLNALYNRLYRFIKWPERDELQTTMPTCFREKFGKKCAVIIDCFEVFSDKPSSVKAQAETFSSYKHHNTVKFLIGITPQGSISFISKGWDGRVSDKHLTECSGMLDKLIPGDLVLADRGFNIDDSVGFYCATIKYPSFLNGKKQLDPLVVEATRKLPNVRIHVERVIGELRQKYRILHTQIPTEFLRRAPNENVSTIDKICTVCCALTNLTPSVVPTDYNDSILNISYNNVPSCIHEARNVLQ